MEVNAALIIPAGSDTISTTVAGCTYLLLKSPEAMVSVHKELRAEFAPEADITIAGLGSLLYIMAVIDEALRIYPPLSGDLRRKIPPGGAGLSGHFLLGGTIFSVYALAASQSAANFAQPRRFVPERWLHADERPEWTKGDHLDACQPFLVGPRNCVGMSLAYAETKLILARLLYRFDMELLDDEFDIERQRVYIMWEKPPLMVQVLW